MKKSDSTIIASLDIGTSKVVCMLARVLDQNQLEVLGVGRFDSEGLKRGVVVNIDATMQAISQAVAAAEKIAGATVRAVYANISGSHIQSLNSQGMVAIRQQQEVSLADVDRVIEAARAVPISTDQKILHVLPQEYFIDNQDGIHEPVGMSGVRLESKVHIVSAGISAVQNLSKCIQKCGLQVNDVVFSPLAAAHAILSKHEKELGVCIIDIGAGTSDIAVYLDGALRHSAVIPIGGDQVTNDLAVAFRTPTVHAESLKLSELVGAEALDTVGETIEVAGVVDSESQTIQRTQAIEVAQARYEELLLMLAAELRRSGFYQHMAAGVVVTGGGSKAPDVVRLVKRIFEMPCRIGAVDAMPGLDDIWCQPDYATAIGLLSYGQYQVVKNYGVRNILEQKMMSKVKQWFQYNF